MVKLMPLHPKTPSFFASFKSRLFTFLAPANLGCPGKEAIKRVYVVVVRLLLEVGRAENT